MVGINVWLIALLSKAIGDSIVPFHYVLSQKALRVKATQKTE
jgi:hypothetical protein